MTLAVVLLAVVLVAGCAHGPLRPQIGARMLQPKSMTCGDGLPIKILISSDCDTGICGWSCLRDRWETR